MNSKLISLKHPWISFILIEFCKLGAKRDDVREVFGSLDNNLFAKVNKVINPKEGNNLKGKPKK